MAETYLGDGLYASFDGWHLNLTVDNHENHVISIDPSVMEKLLDYIDEIKAE